MGGWAEGVNSHLNIIYRMAAISTKLTPLGDGVFGKWFDEETEDTFRSVKVSSGLTMVNGKWTAYIELFYS